MCDDTTNAENARYLQGKRLTRREFGAVSAGAGLAVLLPRPADAQSVTESEIEITTPDGVCDSYFVHPASGAHPGVLIWPDAFGLRPAIRQMATRLAESGYSVLAVNQYYRTKKAPIAEGTNFAELRETLRPLMQSLSPETNVTDAKAFVSFLDSQDSVDKRPEDGDDGLLHGRSDDDADGRRHTRPGRRRRLLPRRRPGHRPA